MFRKTEKYYRKWFKTSKGQGILDNLAYEDIKRTTYWFLIIPIYSKNEVIARTGIRKAY